MEIKFLFQKINDLKAKFFTKESFTQNFAYTFSGNIINLILQIALSPILSRIYTPEAYGVYAIFNAISLNFALVSSLSYSKAILKSPNKTVAVLLAKTSISLSVIFSITGILLLLIFHHTFTSFFELDKIGWLIFLIPISSVFYNINISLSALNIFNHNISKDVTLITSTNIFNRIFNLGYGIITTGAIAGLVIGDVLTKILRSVWLVFVQIDFFKIKVSSKEIFTTFKDYKKYPIYILPSSLIRTFSSQLPIFLFSLNFGSVIVGNFSFASSMLIIPIQLFSNSSSTIFFKKATDTYASEGLVGLESITKKIFWALFPIGVAAYTLLIPFGEIVFQIVFGEEWVTAGEFFSYLAFSYMIMMASQPLINIFLVIHKEKWILWLDTFGIILRIISLVPGIYYHDFLLSIKLFSLANFSYYLIIILIVFKLLKSRLKMLLFQLGLTACLIIAYLALVNFFYS